MKTILIVDDEVGLVASLTELLEEAGYHVLSASNGKDGLVRVITERPDLVLTDFMMPISDGAELIRTLRRIPEFRSLPVVMMSASPQANAINFKDPALASVSFLGKPFHVDEVLGLVGRLIGT